MNKKTRSFIFWMLVGLLCYREIETNQFQNGINYAAFVLNLIGMTIASIKAYNLTD